MNSYRILAINPGSTTTKLAYYEDGEMKNRTELFHETSVLQELDDEGKLEFRTKMIKEFLEENGIDVSKLSMISARGAALPHLSTGAYRVTEDMKKICRAMMGGHASNLACLLADRLGAPYGIPCMIYDSVSADDYLPEAKVSGLKEVPNMMVAHVLNARKAAHKCAEEMGKKFEECSFIVVHVGGGNSVSALKNGKILDVSTNDRRQMSPERCGGVNVGGLISLCYSGKYSEKEMMAKYMGKGGIVDLLGTNDMRKVEDMYTAGDEAAVSAVRGMAYQIAKEIGAISVPLGGKVDKVIYTGGLARFKAFIELIQNYVSWMPSAVYPGEFEMEGLVEGAIRVLNGEEELRDFVE